MDCLHIDIFCRDAAKILRHLYKNFPTKTVLYVEDICGTDTPDEFGLHSPRFESALSTIIWLSEAGILTYGAMLQREAFEGTSLTLTGFNLLQTSDAPLTHSTLPTRIHALDRCLKNGSSNALTALVTDYLSTLETR